MPSRHIIFARNQRQSMGLALPEQIAETVREHAGALRLGDG
ncbi:MAG TPA: hypothetical protein VGE54_04825 [Brevundimonas sp.]